MSFITKLLGGGAVDMATGIADVIDRFVETKEEKEAAEILRLKINQQPDKWQTRINEIEAGHRSLFIAGWRPAIGWICAIALAWGWIVGPTLLFFFQNRELPAINVGQAISLVMALLGLSAVRSYEKKAGISK